VIKEMVERGVENGEGDKEFSGEGGCSYKVYSDEKVNVVDGLIFDVWMDSVSEFGVMVFNVDGFKKLDGKVVKVKKNEIGDYVGWEIVEDDGSVEWEGIYVNGEVKDDVEWMIESDRDYNVFRLVEWKGYGE
jgi:hypothetical protein